MGKELRPGQARRRALPADRVCYFNFELALEYSRILSKDRNNENSIPMGD